MLLLSITKPHVKHNKQDQYESDQYTFEIRAVIKYTMFKSKAFDLLKTV